MPTTFDEVLLDPSYSSEASGGPEFQSVVIPAGQAAAVAYRNAGLEDFIGKYEIDFSQVMPVRRKQLRQFAILREGMTRGFRFLAPDDNELERERLGYLDEETGEVKYLAQTNGSIAEFYLIKHFSDQANNYTRRIIKPSPFDDVLLEWFYAGDENTVIADYTIPAGDALGGFDVINATVEGELNGYGFTFNFHHGKVTFVSDLPSDNIVKISCVYHVPVAFGDDWHNFKVDEGSLSAFRVRLAEILPVELGII